MKLHSFLILSLALFIAAPHASAIVVDGKFDPNEGYTNVQSLYYRTDTGQDLATPGTLYSHVDQATGDVYAAFVVPLSFVDNTYGSNAIGWSGGHKFSDLVLSDSGRFAFYGEDGSKVMDFYLDYLAQVQNAPGQPGTSHTSDYTSGGITGANVSKGHAGSLITGSASNLLEWGTSLSYNFNELGYKLTQNSPATTVQYNPDGSIDYSQGYADSTTHPGWIYEMVYEVKISGAAFAQSGFGGVAFTEIHASPNKVGGSSITLIPEPSTYLIGAGILLLVGFKERKRFSSLLRTSKSEA